MRKYLGMTALILGFSALPFALHAQDEGEGEEDTMVTLPDEAAEEAVENAEFGLETANEARADGRAFGESQAEEARSRGDAGRQTGDDARGDAGDAGDGAQGDVPETPPQAP